MRLIALFIPLLGSQVHGAELALREGTVAIRHGGSAPGVVNPETPYSLRQGDVVLTEAASKARLILEDGSIVLLGPAAECVLEEATPLGESLRLRRGSLHGSLSATSSGLEVRLRDARVTPLHGRFTVQARSGDRAGVGVPSGLTRVFSASGEAYKVGSGQVLWLTRGAALGQDAVAMRDEQPESAPGPSLPRVEKTSDPASAARASTSILGLLEALERDPESPHSRMALNSAVREFHVRQSRLSAALRSSLSASERKAILRKTYASMQDRIPDEAVRGTFIEGHSSFEKREYLLSAERFELCRLLSGGGSWMDGALEEYLARQLPDAVRSASESMPILLAHQYRMVHEALAKSDWPDALSRAERAARTAADAPSRTQAVSQELQTLLQRLRARTGAAGSPEDREAGILDILRSVERHPADARGQLEALLARHWDERSRPWWQKAAEGLRRAHHHSVVQDLGSQTQTALRSGDLKEATRLIVRLLQRDPENPQAVSLLGNIQAQAEKKLGIPAESAAQRAKPARPPARPKPPAEPAAATPAPKDPVKAFENYQAGLAAFMAENDPLARERFLQALRLDPDLEKAQIALKGVERRLAAARKGASSP